MKSLSSVESQEAEDETFLSRPVLGEAELGPSRNGWVRKSVSVPLLRRVGSGSRETGTQGDRAPWISGVRLEAY